MLIKLLECLIGETFEIKQDLYCCEIQILYNQLVWQFSFHNEDCEATSLNCGDLLRAFPTTSYFERYMKTQGNDLGHSNNGKDWIIRSQTPKCDFDNLLSNPVSTWMRFRDYNKMGLMVLTTPNDSLRYSPIFIRKYKASRITDFYKSSLYRENPNRGGLAYSN